MANEILHIERPFTGGLVDDPTKPEQMSEGRDVLFPRGVACERGGFGAASVASPMQYAHPQPGQPLVSAAEVVGLGAQGPPGLVLTDAIGYLGLASPAYTGAVEALGTRGVYHIGPVWGAEVLLLAQDGVSPVQRYAGSSGALAEVTGTISLVKGSTYVAGAGTNFLSCARVGAYLRIGSTRVAFRIVAILSDTQLSIATAWEVGATSAASYLVTHSAPIGLRTLVTDLGLVNTTQGSNLITGQGTSWLTPRTGHGAVMFGDEIVTRGNPGTSSGPFLIQFAPSGTQLFISQNFPETSNPGYTIARPAVATTAAAHRGRLYLAGVRWHDDRVYILPAGYDLGQRRNEIDSFEVNYADASQVKWQDVPGPDAAGRVVALASAPQGLVVLRSDSVHMLAGEYPAISVEKLADVGCADVRAAIGVDDLVTFAGAEGVFTMRGSRLTEISSSRARTWRRLQPLAGCVMGVIHDHLLIQCLGDVARGAVEAGPRTLVYDLRAERWCGDMTLERTGFMHSARNPGRLDDLLAVGPSWPAVMSLGTTIVDHAQDMSVTTNPGSFYARTKEDLVGQRTRMGRLLEIKVATDLTSTGDAAILVGAGADDAQSLQERRIGPGRQTTRVRAGSQALGLRTRAGSVTLARADAPGSTVSRLAVHGIEAVVRGARERV